MKIIYVSGIDGCGKTTQAEALVGWLNDRNISTDYQWLRWEPSVVPLIKSIRRKLKTSKKPVKAEKNRDLSEREDEGQRKWDMLKKRLLSIWLIRKLWLVYSTRDYYRAYKKIRPRWTSEFIVLDRYIFDFMVDQAVNLGISPENLQEKMINTPISRMQQPDYTVIIDLPAEVGYRRKMDGTSLKYLKKREDIYKNCALHNRVLHVDGTNSVDMIHGVICDWLSKEIGIKHG